MAQKRRQQNRDDARKHHHQAGYHALLLTNLIGARSSGTVRGGTQPGAGGPGVLLGAGVTAGLVAADHPVRSRAAVS